MDGGVPATAIIDIQAFSDTIVTEAGQKGLGVIILVDGIVSAVEDSHVFLYTIS